MQDKQFLINSESVLPGFNFGGSGFSSTTGWYGTSECFVCDTDIHSQGMTNIFNSNIRKFSPGDLNGLDLNVQTRGGQTGPADEGVSMVRPYLTIAPTPYTATLGTGGAQATTLQMSSINDGTVGVGQTLLDMSATTSCNVLSITTQPLGGENIALLKTDGNFTPSQQLTLTATSLAAADDAQNAGTIQTLNFHVGAANPAIQVGALIKLGHEFPEAIRALTADPVDAKGNQSITALVRFQHWPGTVGMIGGPAGMYLEQTKFTKNGIRFVAHVYGALDAETLIAFNVVPGGTDPGYLFPGPVKLYWGATITDVRDPGNDISTSCTHLKLEENNAAWPVGGSVEEPNHATAWWQTYVSYVSCHNPFSTGTHFLVSGDGSAFGSVGGGRIFRFINHEPAGSYQANGGSLVPSTAFVFNGTFGGMFWFDTPPQGPLFMLPVQSGLSLVVIENHSAYINYDTANGNDGEWSLVATSVNVPAATFSVLGHRLNQFTVIQGTDGAGTPSLTLKAPANSNWSQHTTTSLVCEGDAVFQGKVTIGQQQFIPGQGLQGPPGPTGPVGAPGPRGPVATTKGFTGTKKIRGSATLVFKNGLLQE